MITNFYGNLGTSMLKLSIAASECEQSFKEFAATYEGIKNRYHPIVWFFMNLFSR